MRSVALVRCHQCLDGWWFAVSVPLSTLPFVQPLIAQSALPNVDSVRLEVLQRVVPSMRHDLMNQLMVIELRTTLLKASLAQQGASASSTNEAVGALCDDIREAIDVGRGLARWMHSLEPVSLEQVIEACSGWVGLAFRCRELALEVLPPQASAERPLVPWPFAASVEAYYGVLTVLWYWFDHAASVGARLTVQAEQGRGCRWRLEVPDQQDDLDPALGWEMAQRLRIDEEGLHALLQAQGWDIQLNGHELWMGCPASGL